MLRPYQSTLKNEIYTAIAFGYQNVLAVAPCGAGKTVIMSSIFNDQRDFQIAIAHRQELVGQISMALARAGIYHRIIAPSNIITFIVNLHLDELKQSYYDVNSPTAVAGVDTMIRRTDQLETFLKRVKWWQTDEAHHVLEVNKWGQAVAAMPHARGVGWTATPARADKRPLKRGEGGVFDYMVMGPEPRWLIDQGFLADYRIFGPKSDMDVSEVEISKATGDYNANQLRDAAHKSHITGDIVKHYITLAAGKRGVTFAVDVELAQEHAEAFRSAGVPAAVIHAKTPGPDRIEITRKFVRGDILQIVNVDVLGEGYDCPGIEVVSLARPTSSLPLAIQQMMRGMRPMKGKRHGIIIDHVGNVMKHGLPDAERPWSLDTEAPKKRELADELPLNCCPNLACLRIFEGWDKTCPYCGFKPVGGGGRQASRPEMVDGDLVEFDGELLERLRAEARKLVSTSRPLPVHMGAGIAAKVAGQQGDQRSAQLELREAIAYWAGVQRDVYGDEDSTSYRRFYKLFGVDVATAQTLGTVEAKKLTTLIRGDMGL